MSATGDWLRRAAAWMEENGFSEHYQGKGTCGCFAHAMRETNDGEARAQREWPEVLLLGLDPVNVSYPHPSEVLAAENLYALKINTKRAVDILIDAAARADIEEKG